MGLNFCVYGCEAEAFDPYELAACAVGLNSDFEYFREMINKNLDAKDYPTLMQHADWDDEWSLDEVEKVESELTAIAEKFKQLPAHEPTNAFEYAVEYRVGATSLYDCFHVVSGENLFEALLNLCSIARKYHQPITLQSTTDYGP